jgi:RNA polymerase sigma-70 factor (ECF subfamily)
MEELTDQQLITLYTLGNINAFEGIINRYAQVLYKYAFKLTNNKDIAHDIVQETFIKIWKNINKFELEKNFKTWIYTIANRTTIDYIRKTKSINFSTLDNEDLKFDENIPDDELLPDEIFEKAENIKLIQDSLFTLSIENRTILLLHHGEEMTFEEIATVINKPMNTVKSQYRRSLIKLREIINKSNAPK